MTMTTHTPCAGLGLGRPLMRAFLILALLGAAGCGRETEKNLLPTAQESIAKKDYAGAIVRLKALLQGDPRNGQARALLGEALLATGDPRGAFIELEKAQESGTASQTLPLLLARAELAQGKFADVVRRSEKLELATPELQAQLMAVRAWALYRLGEVDKAVQLVDEAADKAPRSAPVRMIQARVAASHGDGDKALAAVGQAVAAAPDETEAWLLQAEIAWLVRRDRQGTQAAYAKALGLDAHSVAAHSGLVRIALEAGDASAAASALAAMVKALPRHPQTRYLTGMAAYFRHDLVVARQEVDGLLKEAPDSASVLLLAGMIESAAGSAHQAQSLLAKAAQLEPRNAVVRRELAAAFVRGGEPERAQVILRDLVGDSTRDPALLSLAAQTRLLLGDLPAAQALFGRAAALNPHDLRLRTALLLARLPGVGAERTYGEMAKLAASDSGTYADWAVVSLALSRAEYPRALKALDGIVAKDPKSPLPLAYRADVQLRMGQLAAARSSLEAAMALDVTYAPAIVQLARLDVVQGKAADAQRRLETALTAQPRSYALLMALAEVRSADRAAGKAYRELLTRAIAANPADVQARGQLVGRLLDEGAVDEALALMRDAVAAQPDRVELQELLGRVQIRKGQFESGLTTLTRIANENPANLGLQMALAEGLAQAGRTTEASRILKRTVETAPLYVPALRALTDLAVRQRDFSVALAAAKEVQRRQPRRGVGFAMQGDLFVLQRQWDAAEAAYVEAQRVEPGAEVAAKLVATAIASQKPAEAARRIEQWTNANPKDVRFMMLAADQLMAGKDLVGAERLYQKALALQPMNAVALNNLALVLDRRGRPEAVDYAQRAFKALGDSAAIMDTLAMLKSKAGEHEQALTLQRRALQLEPDNAALRLGLGRILLHSGDKASAREELNRLLQSTANPATKQEAQRLLQQAG